MISNEAYTAGCLLIDGEQVIRAIRGIVRIDDFQTAAYKSVFTAALSLADRGETIDPASIGAIAKRNGMELSIDLLAELMECVPTVSNCAEYAVRVAEDARKRKIKQLAQSIQEDSASSADELLAVVQRETEAIKGGIFSRGLLSPSETLHRFNDYVVAAGDGVDNFIPSGYTRLDRILGGGFIRSGLYIIGARPAMGKSTFVINLADQVRGNCLLVSLEMSPEQILSKRVSRLTGIPSAKMLKGNISDDEWMEIAKATSALSEQGVYINSRYDLTVQQIQLLAQSVPELRMVIVDYLGLIQPATKGASTYESISQISRELKRMAISLNVPVVCLCQLSRAVESRKKDKHPQLSDLRDSGAIEQDADAVMFLYRGDYYSGDTVEQGFPSLVDLDIAKNRHGQTGRTEFNFWLSSSRFQEVTE